MKTHSMNESNWISKTCLAAYVCLILVTTQQRHFERTWTLLYHFSDFMDHIYDAEHMAVASLFEEITKSEEKLVNLCTYLKRITHKVSGSIFRLKWTLTILKASPMKACLDLTSTRNSTNLLKTSPISLLVRWCWNWLLWTLSCPHLNKECTVARTVQKIQVCHNEGDAVQMYWRLSRWFDWFCMGNCPGSNCLPCPCIARSDRWGFGSWFDKK